METIKEFQDGYRWLSNFWECPVHIDGIMYQSSEAAFQAHKTTDKTERKKFAKMGAAESKKAGKTINLREDWEDIKRKIMYKVLICKFSQNSNLLKKLIDTGDAELIEGNVWNDKYWGVCDGEGENWLGKLLMEVRAHFETMGDYLS